MSRSQFDHGTHLLAKEVVLPVGASARSLSCEEGVDSSTQASTVCVL